MPRIKKILVEKILTDDEVKNLKGELIDESYIKIPVIKDNIDVYYKDGDEEKLLLKFRKNVLTDNEIKLGWKCYKDLAKPSRGRGASAGPIDAENVYWKKRNLHKTNKWSTSYLLADGTPSKMRVNNQVFSTPIGYYADMKNMQADLPCRLTHFTRTNFEKYKEGIPFIQKIDKLYQRLIPDNHKKQLDRANLKPHLKIPDTSFSTITINRNFRTALHKDAGDFSEGFGNLTVIERGKYQGGYTVFPQFGVAVDVRNNDFLAMDVHQWHSNTEIYETEEDRNYNESIPKAYNDNIEVGTIGIDKLYTRLTFVCYLRENLVNCPDTIDPRFLTKSGHSRIKD